MLRYLSIEHLAVIDKVEIEFEPGLNVLTGETGAGKSILVEAVGLLLGARASSDLVRTGEDVATIQAIFDSGDGEVIVRRELTSQGRSRAFVNGALATAATLRDLASRLIELHGQHDHQGLLEADSHLDLLDAYAGLEPVRAKVADAFQRLGALRAELETLRHRYEGLDTAAIAREVLGRDASAQTLEALAKGLEGKEPTARMVASLVLSSPDFQRR